MQSTGEQISSSTCTVIFFFPTGYQFESDQSITPLESALTLLNGLAEKCSVSQEDVASARSSIEEMVKNLLSKVLCSCSVSSVNTSGHKCDLHVM